MVRKGKLLLCLITVYFWFARAASITLSITADHNLIKDANNYNTIGKYNETVDLEEG